jgi:hypothetical protein
MRRSCVVFLIRPLATRLLYDLSARISLMDMDRSDSSCIRLAPPDAVAAGHVSSGDAVIP